MDDHGTTGAGGGIRFRKLRIAWSAVCGILCLLLIVMWVRSYTWLDYVGIACGQRDLVSTSNRGKMSFRAPMRRSPSFWGWESQSNYLPATPTNQQLPPPSLFKFTLGPPYLFWVRVPHAFLALLVGIVAALPWLPYRFSLRTLLIGMTLVAVALGMIFALSR